jgi:hypothetical protein
MPGLTCSEKKRLEDVIVEYAGDVSDWEHSILGPIVDGIVKVRQGRGREGLKRGCVI